MANSMVTISTVVTTEATSSAVRVGWPRGATKLASMSLATKIKRTRVKNQSKQEGKTRLKKSALICIVLGQKEALAGIPPETKLNLETIKSKKKRKMNSTGGELLNRLTASPMIEC